MASILNKFGRHNNTTGVAQPYAQDQLLLQQQQGQLYGTQQPMYGGGNVVSQQQLAIQQQQFQSGVIAQPAETIVAQPIVQETVRQDRVVEVQPVIHRDIERPVVNHIEKHITEPATLSRAGNIQHQPIVQQTYHDRVINEVQPIIHREVAIPQVEQLQQHYVEHVVANPQHTRQVVYEQIPSQVGRGYIQQGIGSQTYLQSGLVSTGGLNTGALSTYNPGFMQQQLLRQEQQQLLNPQSQYLANEFGMNQRGGLLQHQQLLPQNYGGNRILAQGAGVQPGFSQPQQGFGQQSMLQQGLLQQQQPFLQQGFGQQQPFLQQGFGQQQFGGSPFITASPLTSAAPFGAPLSGGFNQGFGSAPLTQQQYNQEIGRQTYAAQAATGFNPNMLNNNNVNRF